MAAAPLKADTTRMSFARVAASAGKENVAMASFAKVAATSIPAQEPRKQPSTLISNTAPSPGNDLRTYNEISAMNILPSDRRGESSAGLSILSEQATAESKLVDAVKALYVQDSKGALVVNGSSSSRRESRSALDSISSDEPYNRGDSGSDLGTKPPSLDGKSITSGTTFALDEKESLRPDDSASVKAAAEDDDTFSGRGSIVAGSRMGSEAAARAYRSQLFEHADRRIHASHEPLIPGIITPQSSSSGQQLQDENKSKHADEGRGTEAFNLFYSKHPDEKLLEALQSPKDRLFLLRIEQDVIEFVKQSKEPFIDLPPCNSFCRMLTHKLADYYHLTHQVDAVAGAVRIFRTPFCRLPDSLASLSAPSSSANTPPPPIPTMKIMRRDGGTGPSPSKATSETGSDAREKANALKEKLSREDREAAYNKARERIFGNSEKNSEVNTDAEGENDLSRSSSTSARDKAGVSKRGKVGKQRRDDADTFDVRSQYAPYFPPQQQQPSWAPSPQYAPMPMQQRFGPGGQPVYHPSSSPSYSGAPQPYPAVMMSSSMSQYSSMPQFAHASQQPFPTPPPPPMYGSPSQPPPGQQWGQNVYPNNYPNRATISTAPPIPYAYGKLPGNSNPADPKSQHPIPGSYNRHAFNPQTQSFVPGNGGSMQQPPMGQHGSPHLPYNAYPVPPPHYANGMGYPMVQSGSNNSLPPYQASPGLANRPAVHQGMPTPASQGGIHLPNYGNTASLPPKPPPTM